MLELQTESFGIRAVVLDIGHTVLYPTADSIARVIDRPVEASTYMLALGDALRRCHRATTASAYGEGNLASQAESAAIFFQHLLTMLGASEDRRESLSQLLIAAGADLWDGVFDDVRSFVQDCRRRGLVVAALTNSDGGTARRLASLGLTGISPIFDSALIGSRKPDPAVFEHVRGGLGFEAAECLLIGDSPISDMWGGWKSGWRVQPIWRYPEEPPPPWTAPDGTKFKWVSSLADALSLSTSNAR
jgi:putative hydrolase of the HAD superfamily